MILKTMIQFELPESLKPISLNKWYSGTHWSKRHAMKKEWKEVLGPWLSMFEQRFEQYGIELEYNSRFDPSNTIPIIKLIEDVLVEESILINDTKKYCKEILIKPNLELPLNTYIVRVYDKSEGG